MNAFSLIGKNTAIIGDYGTEFFYLLANKVSHSLREKDWVVYNQYDWAISCRSRETVFNMSKAIIDTSKVIIIFPRSQKDNLTQCLIKYALFMDKKVVVCEATDSLSLKKWVSQFEKEIVK